MLRSLIELVHVRRRIRGSDEIQLRSKSLQASSDHTKFDPSLEFTFIFKSERNFINTKQPAWDSFLKISDISIHNDSREGVWKAQNSDMGNFIKVSAAA